MDFLNICSTGKTWWVLLGSQWKEEKYFQILTWFSKALAGMYLEKFPGLNRQVHLPQYASNHSSVLNLSVVITRHSHSWACFVPMVKHSKLTIQRTSMWVPWWLHFSLSLIELCAASWYYKSPNNTAMGGRVNKKAPSGKYFSTVRKFLGCNMHS